MGTVWYAEHLTIGRRAAIKVLRPELSDHAGHVSRFIREAQAVNAIRHPNIVDVTDFGEVDGLTYLVMELLEGETLGERLEGRGRLELPAALAIVRQIGLALGAAHSRGIVHRDLKPENVFLCAHEDYPDRVKVLDFGIAKLAQPRGGFGRATRPGLILGTPAYMSPEQCLADATLDHRSDQYSLAVVTYEMLVGEPPFTHHGFGRMVVAHAHEEPTPPQERTERCPPRVGDVLLKALRKDPEHRYPSVRAFVGALEEAVEGGPPEEERAKDEEARALERRQSDSVGRELTRILRRRFAYGRAELPAIPLVVMDCLHTLAADDPDLGRVARSLERDPLIASRLLKVVNTVGHGGQGITSVQQAVGRLGIKQTKALLLELSARQVFTSRDPMIRRTFRLLWTHCLAVGTLARSLAQELDGAPDPDAAYLAGLLHDVGKPIVAAFLLDAERNLLEALGGQSWMRDSVWLRIVERTHREAGRALAGEWKLPPSVLATIENQHRYEYGRGLTIPNLVRYANALVRLERIDAGDVDRNEERAVALEGRELLEVDEEVEGQLTARLEGRVRELTQDDTERCSRAG